LSESLAGLLGGRPWLNEAFFDKIQVILQVRSELSDGVSEVLSEAEQLEVDLLLLSDERILFDQLWVQLRRLEVDDLVEQVCTHREERVFVVQTDFYALQMRTVVRHLSVCVESQSLLARVFLNLLQMLENSFRKDVCFLGWRLVRVARWELRRLASVFADIESEARQVSLELSEVDPEEDPSDVLGGDLDGVLEEEVGQEECFEAADAREAVCGEESSPFVCESSEPLELLAVGQGDLERTSRGLLEEALQPLDESRLAEVGLGLGVGVEVQVVDDHEVLDQFGSREALLETHEVSRGMGHQQLDADRCGDVVAVEEVSVLLEELAHEAEPVLDEVCPGRSSSPSVSFFFLELRLGQQERVFFFDAEEVDLRVALGQLARSGAGGVERGGLDGFWLLGRHRGVWVEAVWVEEEFLALSQALRSEVQGALRGVHRPRRQALRRGGGFVCFFEAEAARKPQLGQPESAGLAQRVQAVCPEPRLERPVVSLGVRGSDPRGISRSEEFGDARLARRVRPGGLQQTVCWSQGVGRALSDRSSACGDCLSVAPHLITIYCSGSLARR